MPEDQDLGNIYDEVYDSLLTMPQHLVLARSTYGEHFTKSVVSQNIWEYRSKDRRRAHETILVGEIRPATCGTRFSAVGNHYIGSMFDPNYIEDSSRIKSVFILGKPEDATSDFNALFDNQLATLTEVIEQDKRDVPIKNGTVKDWTACADTDRITEPDYIIVTTDQMYTRTNPQSASAKSKPRKKMILTERAPSAKSSELKEIYTHDYDDDTDMALSEDVLSDTSPSPSAKGKEKAKTLTTNDLHPPTVLPDYGGDLFKHVHTKLHQFDFRDMEDELIPPQQWYSELRQGTLVLVRASLHAYTWNQRRVYQLSAHTIRVLRKSTLDVETRRQFTLGGDNSSKKAEPSEAAVLVSKVMLGKRNRD